MCLLTTSTIRQLKEVFLNTHGLIKDVYDSNSDGLGVMYSDGRKLHVHKVLPRDVSEARQFIESLPDSDHMIACHWRMKTHGLIDMDNCHPYRVNAETYLAHNGILHTGNSKDKDKSDTWHFIEDYLSTMPTDALHDPKFVHMLGEFIENNRFAIMSADGRLSVVNRDQGIETHGVWFSNTYAWSPELLIPNYARKPSFKGFYNYMPMLGADGYLVDYDEGVEDDDTISIQVYDALEEYDEAALGGLIDTYGSKAINVVLNEYELSPYKDTPDDLDANTMSVVDAWLTGDDAYLALRAARNPGFLAQCLMYYCDWDWVGSEKVSN